MLKMRGENKNHKQFNRDFKPEEDIFIFDDEANFSSHFEDPFSSALKIQCLKSCYTLNSIYHHWLYILCLTNSGTAWNSVEMNTNMNTE